jgi:aldehyde:ferredoxin oxidoreductase
MQGYGGRMLFVDCTTGATRVVTLAENTARALLGGNGLAARVLLDHVPAGIDAFDPANAVVFAVGPVTDTTVPGNSRACVAAKSPLTGLFFDSTFGGRFPATLKRTGFDAVVITGRAAAPSYVSVDESGAQVKPAPELWGRSTREAVNALIEAEGADADAIAIGPAGEQRVRFAAMAHYWKNREGVSGRGGIGAVLGSKNIKAIAVRGTHYCEWARPRELTELSRDLSKRSFGPATAKYRELGTAANLLTFNRLGTLPTRNFQSGTFADAPKISAEQLSVERSRTRASCVACTIGCEHIYSTGRSSVRLEYESLFALGSLCGVADSDAVLRASQRCDELGIDTISAGGTIAFAMECVERGVLDEPWLTFGSGDAVLKAIDLIGRREGIGRLLAEGSRRAAEAIGQGSLAFAPQVKGLEIPGYEPRALQTMALGFAVGARGADHNRSGAYEVDFSEKVDRRNATLDSVSHAIETEDKAALMDSLILCKFLRGVFTDFHAEAAVMLQAVTGWDVTADELRETARRIVATKRQVNLLAGWTPEEDTLPERFLDAPLSTDPGALLTRARLQELVAEYHRQRGW